ncbi:protein-export membrane protein SecF [Synechocystis sp. LKSZ1]
MYLNLFKWEKLWWTLSVLFIVLGLIAMAISWTQFGWPIKPGLDFIGGTRLQLQLVCAKDKSCPAPIDVAQVRDVLTEEGLGNSTLQVIENYTLAIRSQTLDVNQRNQIQQSLSRKVGKFDAETIQIDTVGPTIGKELFQSGSIAFVLSLLGIIVYLAVRFQWDYAFFAVLALIHDVLVTAGAFALLSLMAGVEIDSLFLVSLLTIIGFSVNDTVVIYDRIRETLTLNPNDSVNEIVEAAVNQTLSRSINTTLTALLPLIAIFFFGGETLKFFALALIIGFTSGAYSSIFIASTLWAWWRNRRNSGKQTAPA